MREVVEDIKTGKTPSKNENKYYENGVLDWFKPSEIGEGKYLKSAKDKLSQLAVDTKQATIYQPGTLLVTAIGDIGRLAITTDVASSNQQITGIAFNKQVLPEYAYYYFLAFRAFFYTDVSQTTLPIVNQKKITSIPFILCSVKEQKATIDFLSAIELITLPEEVGQLNNLTNDSELLEVAKGIFATHFASAKLVSEFDNQELHLNQLRQALLREAMQGQLLPQDPTDEPAAVLLQKLQAEKAKLGKAGKRKQKELFAEETEAVEGPFEIPSTWSWCTLGEATSKIGSGSTPKSGYVGEGIPFFRSQNIYDAGLELSDVVYISKEVNQTMRGTQVLVNDVLLNITGGSLGRATLVTDLPNGGNVSQHVCIVRAELLASSFLHKLILSPYFQNLIFASTSGAGRQGLPKYNLEQFLVPVPPLAEQHRIVAKLEQLMQHCDALEQRIRESRRLAEQLLQTALREALAPPAGAEVSEEEAELELVEADAEPAAAPRRRGRPAKKAYQPGDHVEFGDLFSQPEA
ncbi:hypothetical protein HER32_16730 [Hymenobacter sp. BT18]|uniref:restriction endonuclease subunit S n=1 Tax=Hymenobacter sp. BT18 TaxID=2835648 RepID=UPI00143E1643|nr:restriction endonuclease subunit S [Hymenobacter sp. BT18]QIX62728.1 hypothetical protein HER32_16730 [Hymenobacter sp. BT18]